jgi:hypothetical protein
MKTLKQLRENFKTMILESDLLAWDDYKRKYKELQDIEYYLSMRFVEFLATTGKYTEKDFASGVKLFLIKVFEDEYGLPHAEAFKLVTDTIMAYLAPIVKKNLEQGFATHARRVNDQDRYDKAVDQELAKRKFERGR